jgi:polyprenyl-phospho-N-acetylgalactosaminyl synthase
MPVSKLSKKDCVVVIPAYNEAKYLKHVVRGVKKAGFRFVIVDDGSADQTFQMAQELTGHALQHELNLGKGAALKTGCRYAFRVMNAKAVIFMDSDAQHDPSELQLFVTKLKGGVDIVLGVRAFDNAMPLIKIMGNRFASFLVLALFGTYIPDIPSGYKALSKKGYNSVRWSSTDYRVELEIAVKIARQKLPFSTVPVTTIYADYERGFQFLDALQMIGSAFWWRIHL